jgi:hypothetical protein
VGDALLILAEIFAWGLVLLLIGALVETGWSRLRRRLRRDTLVD